MRPNNNNNNNDNNNAVNFYISLRTDKNSKLEEELRKKFLSN